MKENNLDKHFIKDHYFGKWSNEVLTSDSYDCKGLKLHDIVVYCAISMLTNVKKSNYYIRYNVLSDITGVGLKGLRESTKRLESCSLIERIGVNRNQTFKVCTGFLKSFERIYASFLLLRDLTPSEKGLIILLSSNAKPDNKNKDTMWQYSNIKKLAVETGFPYRTLADNLKSLVDKSLVTVENNGKSILTYSLTLLNLAQKYSDDIVEYKAEVLSYKEERLSYEEELRHKDKVIQSQSETIKELKDMVLEVKNDLSFLKANSKGKKSHNRYLR